MRWRAAAVAAFFLAATSCGGNNQSPPAGSTNPKAETPSAATASTAGDVNITGKIAPALAPASTFIALELEGDGELPIKSEPAVMDQVSQVFLPAFVVAQVGQKMEFRNSDDVLHNIRVTESSASRPIFNVATPPAGKYEFTFERPGIYTVGCDIHPTMRADILVTATPYTATTSDTGSFTIADVRPGQYTLKIFAGGEPIVRTIDVKAGQSDLGVIQ
jgi:plastocyanin